MPLNLPGPARTNSQMPIQPFHSSQNSAAQNHAIDPALHEEHSWSNPGVSNQGRQKYLMQPMGQNWAQKWQYALEEDLVQKSLKTLHQENVEKKKCMCDIHIWFQNGQQLINLAYYIPTYPDLPLQLPVEFIDEKDICVDYYLNGRWQTSQPDVVLTVNKAHTVLIRLCRSLLEPLTDCPGLDDKIKLQPRTSSRNKRGADDLVSPIKKVPCVDQDSAPLQSKGKGKERAVDIIDIDSPSPSPLPQVPTSTSTKIQPNSKSTKPFPLEHLLAKSGHPGTSCLSGSRKAFP
ncbi:hypothetical protein PILCRDRAFT_12383 [Piloderma croceum F 1598]|uniref:Uncharacterized protein n=1 Tax=Piloderma croceum (strain F 1598) TaxID=765440 RepID=A0A0C3BI32_PILCF|nr:hypothetical protein PILCRDRAFT_12383 [Piloderma croceum F 1598]